MVLSEESRHQLYSKLETILGTTEAATLTAHLPPLGWADIATKQDLVVLGAELRGEMGMLRGELKAEMRTQTRTLFLSLVGLQLTAAGLVVAISHLS